MSRPCPACAALGDVCDRCETRAEASREMYVGSGQELLDAADREARW